MKIKTIIVLFVAASISSMLTGCAKNVIKNNDPGNGYLIFPGKAKIVSIAPSLEIGTSGMYNIFFDFFPDESVLFPHYTYPETPDKNIKLYQDHRYSFHGNWIKNWDIKVGNIYPALRSERKEPLSNADVYFEILFDTVQK